MISSKTKIVNNDGFTLVELLVVVAIIGLLALIAIPTFLNQRHKAQDARAKSAVRNSISTVSSSKDKNNEWADTGYATSAALVATLNDAEPAFTWQTSASSNPEEIYVLRDSATKITISSRSSSGTIYCADIYSDAATNLGTSADSGLTCNGDNWGVTDGPGPTGASSPANPEDDIMTVLNYLSANYTNDADPSDLVAALPSAGLTLQGSYNFINPNVDNSIAPDKMTIFDNGSNFIVRATNLGSNTDQACVYLANSNGYKLTGDVSPISAWTGFPNNANADTSWPAAPAGCS